MKKKIEKESLFTYMIKKVYIYFFRNVLIIVFVEQVWTMRSDVHGENKKFLIILCMVIGARPDLHWFWTQQRDFDDV